MTLNPRGSGGEVAARLLIIREPCAFARNSVASDRPAANFPGLQYRVFGGLRQHLAAGGAVEFVPAAMHHRAPKTENDRYFFPRV